MNSGSFWRSLLKKSLCALFLGLALVMTVVPVVGTRPQNAASDDFEAKARLFLTRLTQSNWAGAVADFDETMLKVSGPEKCAEMWRVLQGQLGAFRKQTSTRREKMGVYDIIYITCEFEKTPIDSRIVFDKKGKIAGLQFVPTAPAVSYAPPSYGKPELFEESSITVGAGGAWPLPGILTRPKGNGPFPALVLVHGSGPNDMDETIGPNKPFKDLAWGLASRGIAVLRYDKRTRIFGPKIVADPRLHASLTVKEETVDDALAAVELLVKTPGIDPKRIFVLGHSLGAMLVPRIAEAAKNLDIAGFVVMAGPSRPLEDLMVDQNSYLSQLGGSLSDEDRKTIEGLKAEAEKIKAVTEKDVAAGSRFMNLWAGYWLDLKNFSPPEAAVKFVKKPLLVLQGERDYQVKVVDFEGWKKELGKNPAVVFKLYPKLNHLFMEGTGNSTPNEYMGQHASVAEYVIGDIASFILK